MERAADEPVNALNDPSLGPLAAWGRVTHAIAAPVQASAPAKRRPLRRFRRSARQRAVGLWVVESYARLTALCLHDPAVLQGLLRSAREDALTGCLNFATLRSELIRETSRAARYGHDLSVCFIDLDKFKRVNDQYGHRQGNRVLVEVATALRTCMRAGDVLEVATEATSS